MKITIDALNELKTGEVNSWAIWNNNGNSTVDFFESNIDKLHGKAVFLGLNRSEGKKLKEIKEFIPFRNFHADKHTGDRRLKRIIQEEPLKNLIGGFFTDLSDVIHTKSAEVQIEEITSLEVLKKKLSIIKSDSREMVCFGDKVFNSLCNALKINKEKIVANPALQLKEVSVEVDGEKWNLYRVWHYSNYGKFILKSEKELPEQLRYINDKMNGS